MCYDEVKELSEEAWKQKYSYLKIKRVADEEKYGICNESKREYKLFKPVTDPFSELYYYRKGTIVIALLLLNTHTLKVHQLLLLFQHL